ncbi:MAG: hypothetical protein HA495_03770 [Thaumarchaeota archaeon]|nr:hypothetical protein [Nitrososphaerota archaeon]
MADEEEEVEEVAKAVKGLVARIPASNIVAFGPEEEPFEYEITDGAGNVYASKQIIYKKTPSVAGPMGIQALVDVDLRDLVPERCVFKPRTIEEAGNVMLRPTHTLKDIKRNLGSWVSKGEVKLLRGSAYE